MRLHDHGQAIFVHLSFKEKLSSIQSSFLIEQILKKGMLDFQLTDFMFNRAKGFHGPFKSKLLMTKKNADFFILGKELSSEPKKFEHEWSHALTEYHEFLILNFSSNNIFCLLLAYD